MDQQSMSPRCRQRGLSLFEVLITLAIVSILGALVYTSFFYLMPRIKLQNVAQETTVFLRQARQDAIRASMPIVIQVEELTVDGLLQQWLVSNLRRPDGTLEPRRQFLVSNARGGIFLRGPELAHAIGGPEGFSFTGGQLTIRSNGTVVDTGAIRISDGRGAGGDADPRNVMEITFTTRSGTTIIRKYLSSADSPTGVAGFFEQRYSDGSTKAAWQWY